MNTDFTPNPAPVMIPANTPMRMFSYSIAIISDAIIEADETFTLSLPDQSSVTYTIGENSTLTAIIENDDCM